jgi:hypothetical protein
LGAKKVEEANLEEWLLTGEPWVVYRVLTDLVGKDNEDPKVALAKAALYNHPLVRTSIEKISKEGNPATKEVIDAVFPRNEAHFWVLPVLADFGLTILDSRIAKVCEQLFSKQLDSGRFKLDLPSKLGNCLTAIITETLAKLGLLNDPRLQKAYEYLLGKQKANGEFCFNDSGQIEHSEEKPELSSASASTFALGALAQNPDLRDSDHAKKGVDFLFQCWASNGKTRNKKDASKTRRDWGKLRYPFTDYRILKFLDILSQFNHATKRLRDLDIIDELIKKQDAQGRFTPESVMRAWSDFDFGQKEKPSRWITFLAMRIAKRIL